MRRVERLEGLALAGSATVGPLHLRTPALLRAHGTGPPAEGISLAALPSASGSRRLALSDGQSTVEVELPVLAPEITSTGTGVVAVDPRTVLLHAPLDEAALRALRSARPELLVLGNARALWSEGWPLVQAVRAVRSALGSEPLLWGPRVALPHRLPLLAYLGFDLLDTTEGELRASEGELLDPALGPRPALPGGSPRGCDCEACAASPPGSLAAHARAAYRRATLELDAAIARGELRVLVEARLAAEPALAELLRYADRELGDLLEARAPVIATGSHTYVLAEGVRRAEMRRFRDRLVERYRPPPSKTVLLLVPCSRTKPYRKSPSHRRFSEAWSELTGVSRIHVVSLSSPIGVVPRELEDVPPARQYDIPVTGDWTAEEQELVLRGVRHLLASGSYRHVVPHLDPEEYGFVLDALPAARRTDVTVVGGRPTSAESIARLRATLARCLADRAGPAPHPLEVVAEELQELAAVQFGREAASRLFARPRRLLGRPWFQRLTDGERDLASVREERGLFHLTVAGALRLGDTVLRVDAEPTLSLEGDLFAPGVLRADPRVRIGDSVGVFQDDRLAAVGEACLPGPLLGDLRHGIAVRVRHRRGAPADMAKTDGDRPPLGR